MHVTRRRFVGSFAAGAGSVLLAACGAAPSPTALPAKPTEAPKPAATTAPAAGATTATAPAAATKPAAAATTAPAAAAKPTEAAKPAAAAPATGGAPVSLSVIAWNSGTSAEAFKNAMQQMNDKFKQQKPNVTVNFEALGQGANWTNAQKARISGQTADVTATYGFAPQDIINFQPDKQFLDLTGLDSVKNFDKTSIARFMTWKGKVWQLTLSSVGHLVWYNQDTFAKYNLKPPTTYAEFQQLCETLMQNKEQPVLYGAKPSTALSRFASEMEMTVGRPKHPNFYSDMLVQGKADFTTPEWIETFKRAKDFSKKYFDPNFGGIEYATTAGLFAAGKYAMWPEGSFAGGDIMAQKPAFKLGAFNAAFSDDKEANAVHPVYGDIGWAGLNYTKQADVVKDWIDFSGQKENYQTFMQVIQYYPTAPAELTGPVPEAEAPLVKGRTAVSNVRLYLPGMPTDIVRDWGELLLADQHTPESFAKHVQQSFDESKPQWQKYIGTFDNDWAKLYFG
jgi:raffinose/stachyose/melibiose transport system substrate-binding protein